MNCYYTPYPANLILSLQSTKPWHRSKIGSTNQIKKSGQNPITTPHPSFRRIYKYSHNFQSTSAKQPLCVNQCVCLHPIALTFTVWHTSKPPNQPWRPNSIKHIFKSPHIAHQSHFAKSIVVNLAVSAHTPYKTHSILSLIRTDYPQGSFPVPTKTKSSHPPPAS